MIEKAYLDAGIISLFYAKDCPPKIKDLLEKIKAGSIEGHILAPVLIEAFFNICKIDGIEDAKISINSFLKQYPLHVGSEETSLVISAGVLKCQHRDSLSYIDCMSIAYCLNNKCTFHSTEKELKKIQGNTLQKLHIVKYNF